MTKRAQFTEAQIVRMGRAAEKLGKVLVATPDELTRRCFSGTFSGNRACFGPVQPVDK